MGWQDDDMVSKSSWKDDEVVNPSVQDGLSADHPLQTTYPKKLSLLDRFKQQQADKSQSWGDVAEKAVINLPSSIGNIVHGVLKTAAHPIDTASGLLDVAAGGLQNALPDSLVNAIGADKQSQEKASAVGNFYKDRYGSMEGFKNAVATDPAGVAADAATILTAGGGLVSKIPTLEKAGNTITRSGIVIDPLSNTLKAGGKVVDLAKGTAKNVLGLTTGAGGEAINQAYQAGKQGGKNQASLIENMRGNVPKDTVLDKIDANIQAMGKAKSENYLANMEKLGQSNKVLGFDNIEKAALDAMDVSTFTGKKSGIKVSTATSTKDMQGKIANLLDSWKKLPADDFQTAAGLDALKKSVGDLRDSSAFGTPERHVADKVYHAIKNQITEQAPEYASAMKEYQSASDLMSEIRSTLSNKPNASVDTQMRKLQSLMRNNVNTNYGNRLDLVKQLEQEGGNEVLPAIAGQALNTWIPRGLQSASTIPTALAGGAVGGAGLGMAMLPMAMPRLMGEASLKAGQSARYLNKPANTVNKLAEILNANPTIMANYMYQSNQPK